jgi:hypothetical protein
MERSVANFQVLADGRSIAPSMHRLARDLWEHRHPLRPRYGPNGCESAIIASSRRIQPGSQGAMVVQYPWPTFRRGAIPRLSRRG